MRHLTTVFTAAAWSILIGAAGAQQVVTTPRPIPLTRPEMKQLLEELKARPVRIPLPELSPEEAARLGERQASYEMRLRETYLPPGTPSVVYANLLPPPGGGAAAASAPRLRDFTRNADENMSLSYAFKTRLFWIVSRTNNCHYCLGHQEQKLSAVGMTDDQIAALDFDWWQYPPAEQAAFAYARKLTWEPHALSDGDLEALRQHYTDLQILEMTLSIAWNNAINRWKEGLGIPQSAHGEMFFRNKSPDIPPDRPLPIESFLTPTSEAYQSSRSQVAAVGADARRASFVTSGVNTRPPLEPPEAVRSELAQAARRTPRLPLVDEETTRRRLGPAAPDGPLPLWMRLLAHFPNDGLGRVAALTEIDRPSGPLSPLEKARVAWIVARQDRAWYATGLVYQRLRALGESDERIFALDGDGSGFSEEEQAMFRFARQLAMTPIALTDEEFADLLRRRGPEVVVPLVNYVVGRVYFDRVTEAAGLPCEPSAAGTAATTSP
jgi:AhpD family alkylhydroperoxidase